MKSFFPILITILLFFSCNGASQSEKNESENNQPMTNYKWCDYAIKQLVDSIDQNPDNLHLDYTPSVHKLIKMGYPAVEQVIPLLKSENEMTRMHAERVIEHVIIDECGENKLRELLDEHETDWKKIYEKMLDSEFSWSKKSNGLQLGIKISKNNHFYWVIRNVTDKAIYAYSHVDTYEKHYDWININLKNQENEIKTIQFMDDRNKSVPAYVQLQPGERFMHQININQWLNRKINEKANITEGRYQFQVVYYNEPCESCNDFYKSFWHGKLESPFIEYEVKTITENKNISFIGEEMKSDWPFYDKKHPYMLKIKPKSNNNILFYKTNDYTFLEEFTVGNQKIKKLKYETITSQCPAIIYLIETAKQIYTIEYPDCGVDENFHRTAKEFVTNWVKNETE